MYVVAIFLKRYSLMAMGFAINPLGQFTKPYMPSLTEIGIAIFILSFGLLIMTAATKILPLHVPEEELAEHAHHGLSPYDPPEFETTEFTPLIGTAPAPELAADAAKVG